MRRCEPGETEGEESKNRRHRNLRLLFVHDDVVETKHSKTGSGIEIDEASPIPAAQISAPSFVFMGPLTVPDETYRRVRARLIPELNQSISQDVVD
jgi:hypothetical protein